MRQQDIKPDVSYFILMCMVACLLVPPAFGGVAINIMRITGQAVGEWPDVSAALFGMVAFSVPAFAIIGLAGARYINRAHDAQSSAERFTLLRWGLFGGTLLLNVVFVQALMDAEATLQGLTASLANTSEVFMYAFTELFVFGCGAAVGMLFAAMAGHGHRGHHAH
jgi:hypothetical protein